jgi:hypothetical protein
MTKRKERHKAKLPQCSIVQNKSHMKLWGIRHRYISLEIYVQVHPGLHILNFENLLMKLNVDPDFHQRRIHCYSLIPSHLFKNNDKIIMH